MRAEKKQERARNKLAELFGLEAPAKPTGPSAQRVKQDKSREAEAVVEFMGAPANFLARKCRRCQKPFMVNRGNVALCSDFCREKELADVGITWRWDRTPEQRWYYVYDGDKRSNEPLVIGPEATEMILSNDLPERPIVVDTSTSDSADFDDEFLFGFGEDIEHSA